jgi:hypothetical protein
MWPGLDFNTAKGTFFDNQGVYPTNRDAFVEPLIKAAVGHDSDDAQIGTQPGYLTVHSELAAYLSGGGDRPDNLIDRLVAGESNTRAIAKGVCASVLGSATTLVQ